MLIQYEFNAVARRLAIKPEWNRRAHPHTGKRPDAFRVAATRRIESEIESLRRRRLEFNDEKFPRRPIGGKFGVEFRERPGAPGLCAGECRLHRQSRMGDCGNKNDGENNEQ
jgi:hypothetical protein